MIIILHIGPHKTGTTSIQHMLLKQYASSSPHGPIWYPRPGQQGPGHAQLAKAIKLNNNEPLESVLIQAEQGGVERLLLSAEDFAWAFPDHMQAFRDLMWDRKVILVSTQNSLVLRAASMWQEHIKHGDTNDFANSKEWVLNHPGIHPGLLAGFAEAVQPDSIALIYSSPDDPSYALLERTLIAMGLPVDESLTRSSMKSNQRLGMVETEILRRVNEVLNLLAPDPDLKSHKTLRSMLCQQFRSQEWGNNCPRVAIELPAGMEDDVIRRANEVAAAINELGVKWPVSTYGDSSVLTSISR